MPSNEKGSFQYTMKKDDFLFFKINRDRLIAAVFIIFILCMPVITIVSDLLPKGSEDQSQIGNAVLQGNGTLQGNNDAADGEQTEEDADTSDNTGDMEAEKQTWFETVQSSINDFTERLYFRKSLIAFNTDLTAWITGNSYIESTQVLLGKNGWLFYKTENDGHPIYDYMGINYFTDAELSAMANNLTAMRNYFESEGIEFVIMGIPNKENVFPEYMPGTIPKVNEESRADQVAEYLWQNTDLNYVFPKEQFLTEKEKYQIYYKTDTHWNQIGAFVGLQTMFSQLYGTYADPGSVSFVETGYGYAGDLASIAGIMEDYSTDTLYAFDVSSVDQAQYRDEVVLIVGDSFSGFLSVVAQPYYKEVYAVRTGEFQMSMLEEYQPDVIIWESVERYIDYFMNVNLLAQ